MPFYIEQVVAGLTETGVPETLYEPLFARLRARPEMMPVLQAAAVIGRHVDRGLLCSVVDMVEGAVDGVIEELEDAFGSRAVGTRWLAVSPRAAARGRRRGGAAQRAQGLHAKVADALVGVGGERDWRLVAAHYEQAERFNEAATAYQHASASARRRGALTEARGTLTEALGQLDRATPGHDRDRREMALRLERGFLVMTADGQHNRESAADFERCLQLGGTDLRDDELFATLNALTGYYAARADLHRLAQVLEPLRAGLEGRQWFRPAIEVESGVLAWLRGEFDVSSITFRTGDDETWSLQINTRLTRSGSFPVTRSRRHTCIWRGLDWCSAIASAPWRSWLRRHVALTNSTSRKVRICVTTRLSWSAGSTSKPVSSTEAADVADRMLGQTAERPEFDTWRLPGATQHATVQRTGCTRAPRPERAVSVHRDRDRHCSTSWRATGVNAYTTFFDSVLGRLLITAGRRDEARRRLDIGLQLAEDTGMCFYNAELLRLRGHTHTDFATRCADIAAARDLARRQGATLFELRAALDDFELRGDDARPALIDVAERMPAAEHVAGTGTGPGQPYGSAR